MRPDKQHLVEPSIVGWRREGKASLGSAFQDDFEFLGTADYSAYLSVPAALQFQKEHNWSKVRLRCYDLLASTVQTLNARTGRTPAYLTENRFMQMAIVEVPEVHDLEAFQLDFVNQYAVEVPFTQHAGKTYVRISVQAYNTAADLTRLEQALLMLV